MQLIIFSVILLSIIAIIIGVFLGVSSEIFKVTVDEKIVKVRECLPGNNCGGCGYAGCDALAESIAKGEAPVNKCPVGGKSIAEKIAEVMGIGVDNVEKKVAFVHCDGSCANANKIYKYTGVKDCNVASLSPNFGEKSCKNACLGYGNCVKACEFDAIHVIDGVAKVDDEKCVACASCIKACPMNIIELVPYGKKHLVKCSNTDKGKTAIDACKVSCIGCGMCEKTCEKSAIKVNNNLAVMNYDLCDDCNACSEKCSRKCIS